METLRIDVPDTKLTLVTQLLKELGVTVHQEKSEENLSAYQQSLLKVSVWSEADLNIFEENSKGFKHWKPEEW